MRITDGLCIKAEECGRGAMVLRPATNMLLRDGLGHIFEEGDAIRGDCTEAEGGESEVDG